MYGHGGMSSIRYRIVRSQDDMEDSIMWRGTDPRKAQGLYEHHCHCLSAAYDEMPPNRSITYKLFKDITHFNGEKETILLRKYKV